MSESREQDRKPSKFQMLSLGLVRDHEKTPQRHIVRQNVYETLQSNWYPG